MSPITYFPNYLKRSTSMDSDDQKQSDSRKMRAHLKKTSVINKRKDQQIPSTMVFSNKIKVKLGDTIHCSETEIYIIDEYVSKGRYGKVYKVIHENNSKAQPLACKIQPVKMERESTIHRRLTHKHIVKFFGSYSSKKYCFIFMEYCKNGTLYELVHQRNGLTVFESRYFFNQINLGVKYMHKMKIIHRDLKLDNIFLATNMQIKIGDFGLAKRMSAKQGIKTKAEQNRNHYKAPELFEGIPYSAASDVWAVGVILYKMVFHQSPFQIDDHFMAATKFKFKFNLENNADLYEVLKNIFQPMHWRWDTNDCLNSEFICDSKIPNRLPDSILVEPSYDTTDSDSSYEP